MQRVAIVGVNSTRDRGGGVRGGGNALFTNNGPPPPNYIVCLNLAPHLNATEQGWMLSVTSAGHWTFLDKFLQESYCTVEPLYNEVLGTMKITLLYQVSHYIRVKKQRNIKSWDQQNYLVIRGFCYIRPRYNEVPLYLESGFAPSMVPISTYSNIQNAMF